MCFKDKIDKQREGRNYHGILEASRATLFKILRYQVLSRLPLI